MNDVTAEFAYTPRGKVWFWIDVFVESLFAIVFFLIASFGIVTSPTVLKSAAVAFMYYAAAVCISRVHLRLKYRDILDNSYVVSREGISVLENGRQTFVDWDRFTKAEYLPVIPLFRFWTSERSQPIVLFAIGFDRRRKISTKFIREGLNTRLKTRWLPW